MAQPSTTPAKKQHVHLGITEGAPTAQGYQVKKVDRFGSAGKAGILVGDVVQTFNGANPATPAELSALLDGVGVGGVVTVRLLRGGKPVEIKMTLLARKVLNLDLDEVDQVLERKIAP